MPESTHDVAPARSPRTAVGVQAFLAESVAVADGRLFVQGAGWAHLQVPKLPVHPGRLGIGMLLWIPRARLDERIPIALRLEDPLGEPVPLAEPGSETLLAAELSGSLTAEPAPPGSPLDSQVVPLAFNLDGLWLESEGEHALIVEIDGAIAARVVFAVSVG
jgi:hypothetical protein